ncbi:MAG: ATP-dependent Clp protease adaptor ClpS [Clostridia bacterium]|nr:ATP-dependent Clp protease adaptor ClpS [Clostridia bacterium]
METQGAIREHTDVRVQEPRRYRVVMHNDDFTTMDFVVEILVSIFHKSYVDAETIMLKVHKEGRAVVGTYTYDVAVSRVNMALKRAREEKFPFRMTVEEA